MYEEFMEKVHKFLPKEDGFYLLKDSFKMVRKINSGLPVTWWVCAMHPFSKALFEKDEKFFLENKKFDNIIKERSTDISGMKMFQKIWNDAPKKTKESIWSYFQNLLILGYENLGINVSFDAELLKTVYESGYEYKADSHAEMMKGKTESVAELIKKRFASK
tara:strand:- start:66 stop:551 length:486 start_codon:yes stop_codon:yes gene_type:complete